MSAVYAAGSVVFVTAAALTESISQLHSIQRAIGGLPRLKEGPQVTPPLYGKVLEEQVVQEYRWWERPCATLTHADCPGAGLRQVVRGAGSREEACCVLDAGRGGAGPSGASASRLSCRLRGWLTRGGWAQGPACNT